MKEKLEQESELSPHQTANLETHDLGEAILTLARELWVAKDRLLVLEKILVERGSLVENTINSYQPSEEFEQTLSEERDRFLEAVMRSFQAK